MKIIARTLGAALVTAALVAVPAVAQAAEPSPYAALLERDAEGNRIFHPIQPGETAPVTLGVGNVSKAPLAGAVVWIRVVNSVTLPKVFTNCRYYVDSNLTGAWCEFGDELAVNGTYELSKFRVTAAADAEEVNAVIFQWRDPAWAAENGGIDGLAAKHAGAGTKPVAGTQAELELQPRELTVPDEPLAIGFAALRLTGKPTPDPEPEPEPTTPAPTTPAPTTPAPTASPSATPTGGTGGGDPDDPGLPVTGTDATTIAGVGALLLVLGGAAVTLARRRRNFTV